MWSSITNILSTNIVFFFTAEKPPLSLGDVDLGSDMKFKLLSWYNQTFAQFLKGVAFGFGQFPISNPLFSCREVMLVANMSYQLIVSLESLK